MQLSPTLGGDDCAEIIELRGHESLGNTDSQTLAHGPVCDHNLFDRQNILVPPTQFNELGKLTNDYLVNPPREVGVRLAYTFWSLEMTRPILSIAGASARRAARCIRCRAGFGGAGAYCGDDGAGAKPLRMATCDTPQHHQLDFWVGNWQVFDARRDEAVGCNRKCREALRKAVSSKNLTFLADMYRRPGVKYRLAGIGVNRFDGENWLQMWADNQWGAIFLRGAPDARRQHGIRDRDPFAQTRREAGV